MTTGHAQPPGLLFGRDEIFWKMQFLPFLEIKEITLLLYRGKFFLLRDLLFFLEHWDYVFQSRGWVSMMMSDYLFSEDD